MTLLWPAMAVNTYHKKRYLISLHIINGRQCRPMLSLLQEQDCVLYWYGTATNKYDGWTRRFHYNIKMEPSCSAITSCPSTTPGPCFPAANYAVRKILFSYPKLLPLLPTSLSFPVSNKEWKQPFLFICPPSFPWRLTCRLCLQLKHYKAR